MWKILNNSIHYDCWRFHGNGVHRNEYLRMIFVIRAVNKCAENSHHFYMYIVWSTELEFQHFILQHICSRSVTTWFMLVVYARMAVVKATLHSVNQGILRCILIVYYITNQTSTSCNIVLCCDSPYCVPCIFNNMFTPLLWKLSKIYINIILF